MEYVIGALIALYFLAQDQAVLRDDERRIAYGELSGR